MTLEIINKHGEIVQRSRNLRGLISRAGTVGVRYVAVQRTEHGGADVLVSYHDYSGCETKFADFSVALDFFRKRQRRWNLTETVRTPTHSSWS